MREFRRELKRQGLALLNVILITLLIPFIWLYAFYFATEGYVFLDAIAEAVRRFRPEGKERPPQQPEEVS